MKGDRVSHKMAVKKMEPKKWNLKIIKWKKKLPIKLQ